MHIGDYIADIGCNIADIYVNIADINNIGNIIANIDIAYMPITILITKSMFPKTPLTSIRVI